MNLPQISLITLVKYTIRNRINSNIMNKPIYLLEHGINWPIMLIIIKQIVRQGRLNIKRKKILKILSMSLEKVPVIGNKLLTQIQNYSLSKCRVIIKEIRLLFHFKLEDNHQLQT